MSQNLENLSREELMARVRSSSFFERLYQIAALAFVIPAGFYITDSIHDWFEKPAEIRTEAMDYGPGLSLCSNQPTLLPCPGSPSLLRINPKVELPIEPMPKVKYHYTSIGIKVEH